MGLWDGHPLRPSLSRSLGLATLKGRMRRPATLSALPRKLSLPSGSPGAVLGRADQVSRSSFRAATSSHLSPGPPGASRPNHLPSGLFLRQPAPSGGGRLSPHQYRLWGQATTAQRAIRATAHGGPMVRRGRPEGAAPGTLVACRWAVVNPPVGLTGGDEPNVPQRGLLRVSAAT